MNILYLADPNSVHDLKWISFFLEREAANCYVLPRTFHYQQYHSTRQNTEVSGTPGFTLLAPIADFSITRFYAALATAFRIKAIIKKHKIDVVHILYAEPNALWCLFRNFFNVPMVITTRGTDVLKTIPETFINRKLINLLVAPAYKHAFLLADWITSTSIAQVKSIQAFSGRNDEVSVVRTGVDIDTLHHELCPALPEDDKYILFPRFIRPLYNHEFCLEAISLLPPSVKTNYKMVFLGWNAGDPAYQKKLEEKICRMREVKFSFLGIQTSEILISLYKKASLVVMTPLSDGSPVSAMEALLCGARVILGPLDYDKQIFSEGTFILKKWDARELADAIVKILENPDCAGDISENTKLLMDRLYNMKLMKSIYTKLLDDNRE